MKRPEPENPIERSQARPSSATGRQHRHHRFLPIALAALTFTLALAACGGSSKPSSTSKSATTPNSASKGSPSSYAKSQLAASACIRSHGFPNFPDPTFGAGGDQVNLSTNINMNSPGFMLAEKECAKLGLELAGYAPTSTATAAEMAQALAVARCIRAHGVPSWPDPKRTVPSSGVPNGFGVRGAVPGPAGGPIFVVPNSISIAAPAVKQALTACHDN